MCFANKWIYRATILPPADDKINIIKSFAAICFQGFNIFQQNLSLGKCSQTGEEIRYDYFNLDDKAIFRDHEPLIAPAPACTDSDHFYYKEKKLSFTKQEDVYKRSLQAAKKGKTLTFHWRGGYLTKEVLRELLDLIEKAGKERQKTALIKLNWPQAVLRVRYTDEAIQPIVTMEKANEGEENPEGTASL